MLSYIWVNDLPGKEALTGRGRSSETDHFGVRDPRNRRETPGDHGHRSQRVRGTAFHLWGRHVALRTVASEDSGRREMDSQSNGTTRVQPCRNCTRNASTLQPVAVHRM